MEQITQYILRPKSERQTHLLLSEPCVLIGGFSRHFRGLLAHFLKTTIPENNGIELCHACSVEGCSNPRHLYWGTRKENAEDWRASLKFKSPWQSFVDKVGLEEAKKIRSIKALARNTKGVKRPDIAKRMKGNQNRKGKFKF